MPDIGFFDNRVLRGLINSPELPTEAQFISDLLFTSRNPAFGEVIDFEVIEAGQRLARLQQRGREANVVAKQGQKVITVKPPHIREKKDFPANWLNGQGTLGKPYNASASDISSARDRALAREMSDLKNRIVRRQEWLCAQALLGGWTYDDGETSYSLDFGWDTAYTPTLLTTDRWNEPAATFTGSIAGNLRAWSQIMRKATGAGPTKLILGSAATEAFVENDKVKGELNNLNYQVGQATLDVNNNRLGRYQGLDVYTYSYQYEDESGNSQDMIPPEAAILVRGVLESEILYGLIDEESGVYADPFFSKTWVTEDPSARWILASAAPLPVIYRAGSVIYATVV